jgi:hypothetical protein
MAGMLTNDPLFEPVMNSENPEALVSMLAELGYPVATAGRPLEGGGESDQTCPEVLEVNRLAEFSDAVEWALDQPIGSEAADDAILAGINSFLTMCAGGGGPGPCTPADLSPTKPVLDRAICFYELSRSVPHPGGDTECFYKIWKRFVQKRTITERLANCTTRTCTERRACIVLGPEIGQSCGSNGGTCPPVPVAGCIGNPDGDSWCSSTALPVPASWGPWTRTCP